MRLTHGYGAPEEGGVPKGRVCQDLQLLLQLLLLCLNRETLQRALAAEGEKRREREVWMGVR